jgi:hypothetical protein
MANDRDILFCPRCGSPVDQEGRICQHCGRDLDEMPRSGAIAICDKCGRENPAGDGYCRSCGQPREALRQDRGCFFKILAWLKYVKYVRIAALAVMLAFIFIIGSGYMHAPGPSNGKLTSLAGQNYYLGTGNETCQWSCYAVTFHLSFTVSADSLADYRALDDYRFAGGLSFAMDNIHHVITCADPLIMRLALDFRNAKADLGISSDRLLNIMLSFVQSFPNADDINSTGEQEYWRYPVETLADRQGDMIDKSILLASLTAACGFETAMLLDGRDVAWSQAHTSVGVCCGEASGIYYENEGHQYFICETTCPGYKIGQASPDNQRVYCIRVD